MDKSSQLLPQTIQGDEPEESPRPRPRRPRNRFRATEALKGFLSGFWGGLRGRGPGGSRGGYFRHLRNLGRLGESTSWFKEICNRKEF